MTEDRRRHERFTIGIPVTVVRSEPALQIAGRVHDLSASGARIECDPEEAMRLALGDRVTVSADGGSHAGRVIRRKAGELAIVYDADEDVS